jgi:N-acetylglucosaminyldiphosphoundecaprenol N-acetyl-beta-D-mannosaminyltransferase
MTASRPSRLELLGCPVDPYTSADLLAELDAAIAAHSGAKTIHFVNGNKIAKAHEDTTMRQLLWRGDYVLTDGQPLLPMARMLGLDIPERIDGIGLMHKLLDLSHRRRYRVYLLGAKQDVLDKCLDVVRQRYPRAVIAGSRNGYFEPAHMPSIVEQINASNADILFVGIASPVKEVFADEWKTRLHVSLIQGVGGSFDVIAGLVPRAPVWMQHAGLEWLFRVLQEPRRMFWRYATTNAQCLLIFARALGRRWKLSSAA